MKTSLILILMVTSILLARFHSYQSYGNILVALIGCPEMNLTLGWALHLHFGNLNWLPQFLNLY